MSLQDIRRLEHRASELAERIGKQLAEGTDATALLKDMTEQIEVVNLLQVEIQALADAPEGRLSADSLERLKLSFKELVDRVDANVKTVSQKGLRITPQTKKAAS